MALIDCYECGREISNKAVACPHCGAPRDENGGIVHDQPTLNKPPITGQKKSDKERLAGWLSEKQKPDKTETFEAKVKKSVKENNPVKSIKVKRSFSSRLYSGALYGIGGFLGGFGIGRAPYADSFSIQLAAWIGVGIFFGFILFIFGLFRKVKGGKRAVIFGLIFCIILKGSQFVGGYYGAKRGRELAEEYQRRELQSSYSKENRRVQDGWKLYPFKEHNISFSAPPNWTSRPAAAGYLWHNTGEIDGNYYDCFFNVATKAVYKGFTTKQYADLINEDTLLETFSKDAENVEIKSIDKNFKWAGRDAVLITIEQEINSIKYKRYVVQILNNSKSYTLILLVESEFANKAVPEFNKLMGTFLFSSNQ